MAVQFAFNLLYFLDAACTQPYGSPFTFGVAIESDIEDGVDSVMFPAVCIGDTYRTYANSDPTLSSNLTIPQDLQLIYYQGAYIDLDLGSQCRFVNNSHLWQPPKANNDPNKGPFYIQVQENPEYQARCFATTEVPEHKIDDDDDHNYHHHSNDAALVLLFIFGFAALIGFCILIYPQEWKYYDLVNNKSDSFAESQF